MHIVAVLLAKLCCCQRKAIPNFLEHESLCFLSVFDHAGHFVRRQRAGTIPARLTNVQRTRFIAVAKGGETWSCGQVDGHGFHVLPFMDGSSAVVLLGGLRFAALPPPAE